MGMLKEGRHAVDIVQVLLLALIWLICPQVALLSNPHLDTEYDDTG